MWGSFVFLCPVCSRRGRFGNRADGTSNTNYDWLIDHVFLLVPAQDYVGQFLATFRDFPPRQKAATFNMDEVLAKLREAK